MDPRYDDYGGGYANVALYKRLLEHPDTPCYLLYAEGSFHQFHGGVTTGTRAAELEQLNRLIEAQDAAIRGSDRERPAVRPTLLGTPHPAAYRFIRHSLAQA
jgi:hypothetical protein